MGKYLHDPVADLNKRKYASPPTWQQIQDFIDEVGMSVWHFERFYGISHNHLPIVKGGIRPLAAKYWHIFYERIKPTYGSGFIADYNYEIIKGEPKEKKVVKKIKHKKLNTIHHSRLSKLM